MKRPNAKLDVLRAKQATTRPSPFGGGAAPSRPLHITRRRSGNADE
jgi:hypothetical protein